jgi:hypothetical protein
MFFQDFPSTPVGYPQFSEWHSRAYGTYPESPPTGDPTRNADISVGRYGCNMTSVDMIFGRYGIRTDPGQLNSYLRAKNGYDSNNWARLGEEAAYARGHGVDIQRTGLSTKEQVRTQLCSGNPVVLGVTTPYGGHFVLATGIVCVGEKEVTFALNDPIWGQTTLLAQYGDSFSDPFYYSPISGSRAMMQITAGPGSPSTTLAAAGSDSRSPVQLVVTDPAGRRIGHDPRTGQRWNEVPGASYHEISIGSPSGATPTVVEILMPTPQNGNYDIQAIGVENGGYMIDVSQTDDLGETNSTIFQGETSANQVSHHFVLQGSMAGYKQYLPLIRR